MNRLNLDDYLSSLHRQISSSIDRLQNRRGSPAASEPVDAGGGEAFAPRGELRSYAYRLLESSVSYELSRYSSSGGAPADTGYAAGSYRQAAAVNREPTVLIDFMFDYNREFDFKV